ncbi:MAG: BrnT family toxin [Betaproteobacteria bacterium]|nr:MAG: BrnT family toxin [Betaproteobacteria bacterium]TAG44805.1 MAG: BrnT family toxin [Betaproteobacteria bacterium]
MDLFESNPVKAKKNLAKHGISFEEARTVFLDDLSVSGQDPDHSYDEERRIILGRSSLGNPLMVSFVERSGRIRIISARRLTKREIKVYENG